MENQYDEMYASKGYYWGKRPSTMCPYNMQQTGWLQGKYENA